MAGRPRRNPVTAAEAEPEGAPEPAPELVSETEDIAAGGALADPSSAHISTQIAGLENLITRLVGTVEGQNEKIAEATTVQATLLARIARIEERGAAGAAPAAPAPAAPAVVTALEARLIALEKKAVAADKAAKTAAKDVDPDDELDYVPYYEGRGLNPHQVRPQGVTDKPQLYPLKDGYAVYKYLFDKKNAAYHEIGTLACALSYFWDSIHLLDSWKDKFAECGDENAPLAVEALVNSLNGIYGLLNPSQESRRAARYLRVELAEAPSDRPAEEALRVPQQGACWFRRQPWAGLKHRPVLQGCHPQVRVRNKRRRAQAAHEGRRRGINPHASLHKNLTC